MTDNRMKDRVKVMLGTPAETETSEHAMVAPNPRFPDQALQVLTMAQRTAEEHVATAHHQADKIRTDAQAAAEQIARDAQVHAHNVRREADKVLFEARQASEQMARDSRARTEEAQQNVEKILSQAREQAATIGSEAHAAAEELKAAAQLRYDDVVGSLGTRRESLQQQIEALEAFDREYRNRLTHFMQGQLRALWVDQPQVTGELEAMTPPPPAHAAIEEPYAGAVEEEQPPAPNGFVQAQRPVPERVEEQHEDEGEEAETAER
jgi:cell division septum initiation protein DivIVA